MQITLKMTPRRRGASVTALRKALNEVRRGLGDTAEIEEVFPGVQQGHRAGLMTVTVSEPLSPAEREAVLSALRGRADVAYAQPAAARKHTR